MFGLDGNEAHGGHHRRKNLRRQRAQRPSVSERECKAKQATKSSTIDEDGDEQAEARLYRPAHELRLIMIGHVLVGLSVIMGGRCIIVVLRLLSGRLCFILLSLECYSAVDLRFAVDLQEGKGKQARDEPTSIPRTRNVLTMADSLCQLVAGKAEKVATVVHELMHVRSIDKRSGSLLGAHKIDRQQQNKSGENRPSSILTMICLTEPFRFHRAASASNLGTTSPGALFQSRQLPGRSRRARPR